MLYWTSIPTAGGYFQAESPRSDRYVIAIISLRAIYVTPMKPSSLWTPLFSSSFPCTFLSLRSLYIIFPNSRFPPPNPPTVGPLEGGRRQVRRRGCVRIRRIMDLPILFFVFLIQAKKGNVPFIRFCNCVFVFIISFFSFFLALFLFFICCRMLNWMQMKREKEGMAWQQKVWLDVICRDVMERGSLGEGEEEGVMVVCGRGGAFHGSGTVSWGNKGHGTGVDRQGKSSGHCAGM